MTKQLTMTPAEVRAHADQAMTERAFQAQVVAAAKREGWLIYFAWRSFHSPAGYPDLTMCRGNRLLFAELKTEKGKVVKAQQEWLDALKAAGQEAHVWRPSSWPQIVEILRR